MAGRLPATGAPGRPLKSREAGNRGGDGRNGGMATVSRAPQGKKKEGQWVLLRTPLHIRTLVVFLLGMILRTLVWF